MPAAVVHDLCEGALARFASEVWDTARAAHAATHPAPQLGIFSDVKGAPGAPAASGLVCGGATMPGLLHGRAAER
eukprot:8497208-Alexandrium_andersonii.AAC.1